MVPTRRTGILLAAVLAPLLAVGCEAFRGGAGSEAEELEAGRRAYLTYCARCHGESARGGPPQPPSTLPASDLTTLERRRGSFNEIYLAGYIQGRSIEGRRQSAMPAWGRCAGRHCDEVRGDDVRLGDLTVARIVAYLRSLQSGE